MDHLKAVAQVVRIVSDDGPLSRLFSEAREGAGEKVAGSPCRLRSRPPFRRRPK
jgi:hypothetical protein